MAKLGSDPGFSGTEAIQGVDANPTVPKRGWGRGLFAWENGMKKRSRGALARRPSGAAKGWASECFLISEMSLSHE